MLHMPHVMNSLRYCMLQSPRPCILIYATWEFMLRAFSQGAGGSGPAAVVAAGT